MIKMTESVQVGITCGDHAATLDEAKVVARQLGWVIEDAECDGVFLATVKKSQWDAAERNGGWSKTVAVPTPGVADAFRVWSVEIPVA